MRKTLLFIAGLVAAARLGGAQPGELQFIFTSDSHYGLRRASFRGAQNVDAHVVNTAMLAKIAGLEEASFPADGGRRSGQIVGPIDFFAVGGDIANRQEQTDELETQSASKSWVQFRQDYLQDLTIRDRTGGRAPVFVVPGNHDGSNAIGFYKPMTPQIDPASMVGIFNLMMLPPTPKTPATYDYTRDKVLTSRDIGGIHFVFVTVWPDSKARQWMERDLAEVNSTVPVIVFAHDAPDAPAKHFVNPNGQHDINDVDQFENLLSDMLADNSGGTSSIETPATFEQRDWEAFVRKHPNITAYFHGDNNWTQFYDWTGPDHSVVLHTFRADSPLKGHFSGTDETRLSFEIATVDMQSRTMTVREVLWNVDPSHPNLPVAWGASTTVALAPRPIF